MFCANCGTEAKQDAQYCHTCGQKLESEASDTQSEQTPATIPADPVDAWLQRGASTLRDQKRTPPNRNLRPVQTVLSLAGAAFLICLFVLFNTSGSNTQANQASNPTTAITNEGTQASADPAIDAGVPPAGSSTIPVSNDLAGQPAATATPYDTFNGGDAESFDAVDLHMDEDKHWVRLISDSGQHFGYIMFDMNDSDKLLEQTCNTQQECQQIFNTWISSDINWDRPLGLMLCHSGKSLCDVYPTQVKVNAQLQGQGIQLQQLLNQYTSLGEPQGNN